AQFDVTGMTWLSVYGWCESPQLIEYYIIENHGDTKAFQGKETVATAEIDGSSYTFVTNPRTGKPSIKGQSTDFIQYINIRSEPRNQGKVSTAKHFEMWGKAKGQMSKCSHQIVAVEGVNSSGEVTVTV
ncbi:concanavalin A-like lectin/glucanase, partial [Ceraceosorus guamensis]